MDSLGMRRLRGEMRFWQGRMCRDEELLPDDRQKQTRMTTGEKNYGSKACCGIHLPFLVPDS
jgi:hypothetical protein